VSIKFQCFVALFLCCLSGSILFAASPDPAMDHMVQDVGISDLFYNCYTGIPMQQFQSVEFLFPKEHPSERSIKLTTYLMSLSPVSVQDYLIYLKLSNQKASEQLKLLNQGRKRKEPLIATTFEEAEEYCRYFHQTLPTEAEFEYGFYHTGVFPTPREDTREWTKDYYKNAIPQWLPQTDPVQTSPSNLRTTRDKNHRLRIAQNHTSRDANVVFRCVTRRQSPGIYEQALDYQQKLFDSSTNEKHYYTITTNPSGALVYEDPRHHHLLGTTPYFGSTSERNLILTLKKDGYMPAVIHLNTPENRGQQKHVTLKPIPDDSVFLPQREMEMLLVSAAVSSIGMTEIEQARIKNEIVSRYQNKDLSEEKIRGYLKKESPQRFVFVDDFYMDSHEITNAQYKAYLEQSGHGVMRCSGEDDMPVACVNWLEAYEYCQYYNLDLPTETQYEKAVQGASNETVAYWNRKPRLPGKLSLDISRYGIKDLAGNFSEWMKDWYDPEAYRKYQFITPTAYPMEKEEKVVRGASFATHRLDQRIQKRRARNPLSYAMDVGFRCVKNIGLSGSAP
jgi:iron(II)-dependent oxidoreductase